MGVESIYQTLLDIISEVYGVSKELILGKSRKRFIVTLRQLAIYIFYQETYNLSPRIFLTDIAWYFNRHYSYVIYCIQHVRELIETDSEIAKIYQDIYTKVNAKINE